MTFLNLGIDINTINDKNLTPLENQKMGYL